jgi:regulatory protein
MDVSQYFLLLLNRGDYSENKLRTKALQKGFEQDKIEAEISKLKEYNYVNDLRLATNLIRRLSRTKGEFAINLKLQTKGIQKDDIKKAWEDFWEESIEQEDFDPIDYISLKNKITKKFKIDNWQDIEFTSKVKILRYLSYHGFTGANSIITKLQNTQI